MRSIQRILTCSAVLAIQYVDAFQPIARPAVIRFNKLQSSKDDEIAKLEEQLKRLKEEQAAESSTTSKKEEEPVEEVPLELFLSEKWKEEEAAVSASSEGGGGGFGAIGTILGAVGLAVFLAIFSQVPVGQEDLSKYSAIKAPSEQIDLGDLNRARNSGDI